MAAVQRHAVTHLTAIPALWRAWLPYLTPPGAYMIVACVVVVCVNVAFCMHNTLCGCVCNRLSSQTKPLACTNRLPAHASVCASLRCCISSGQPLLPCLAAALLDALSAGPASSTAQHPTSATKDMQHSTTCIAGAAPAKHAVQGGPCERRVVLLNVYGCTEAAGDSTVQLVTRDVLPSGVTGGVSDATQTPTSVPVGVAVGGALVAVMPESFAGASSCCALYDTTKRDYSCCK